MRYFNEWTTSYSTSFLHKLWILTDCCINIYQTPAHRTYSIEFYLHLLFFHSFFISSFITYYYNTFLSKWKKKKKLGHHINCLRLNRSCIRCCCKLIWVGKFSVCLRFYYIFIMLALIIIIIIIVGGHNTTTTVVVQLTETHHFCVTLFQSIHNLHRIHMWAFEVMIPMEYTTALLLKFLLQRLETTTACHLYSLNYSSFWLNVIHFFFLSFFSLSLVRSCSYYCRCGVATTLY